MRPGGKDKIICLIKKFYQCNLFYAYIQYICRYTISTYIPLCMCVCSRLMFRGQHWINRSCHFIPRSTFLCHTYSNSNNSTVALLSHMALGQSVNVQVCSCKKVNALLYFAPFSHTGSQTTLLSRGHLPEEKECLIQHLIIVIRQKN